MTLAIRTYVFPCVHTIYTIFETYNYAIMPLFYLFQTIGHFMHDSNVTT